MSRGLLSLILRYIPKGYFSTYLLENIESGSGALAIEVMSKCLNKNILFVDARALDFNRFIKIIIFNSTKYHISNYSVGRRLYILGSPSFKGPDICISNPKIIKEINTINLIFKEKSLKFETIRNILTMDNLLDSKLPENIAKNILKIFFPTKEFYNSFYANRGFSKDILDSIKFIEIFNFLDRFSKKKRFFRSKFQCYGDEYAFINLLPFMLTKDQLQAIKDIKQDLGKAVAAKRIIMGDVGCGKTIVILASVVICYPHKSILMAPTTILATQLFNEAKKFLPPHIKVSLLISSNVKKQDFENADFIIGTQTLLYQGFSDDFGLVMTDEQHRFGTKQRYKLEELTGIRGVLDNEDVDIKCLESKDLFQDKDSKNLKEIEKGVGTVSNISKNNILSLLDSKVSKTIKKAHVLQFSATPIPRSMSLINSNIVNYSFIKEMPFKKDIETIILSKQYFTELINHIKEEISKDNQVAVIYPLVEKSEKSKRDYIPLESAKSFWVKSFKKVFFTHGRDKQKEKILKDFAETKGGILLATTMVEVGISLPRLTIIAIVGAEFLGLASLHQLRGRVSRNGLKGYCYLITNNENNQRLKDFASTMSGFEIAELDLKYRNSGDLIEGKEQSGNMFEYFDFSDLYILKEAQKCLNNAQ